MAHEMDAGREAQFQEMMDRLAQLQARYKGVRGELLEKVRAELMALRPTRAAAPAQVEAPLKPPTKLKVVTTSMLPSCRSCGRTTSRSSDGALVCPVGHRVEEEPARRAAQG